MLSIQCTFCTSGTFYAQRICTIIEGKMTPMSSLIEPIFVTFSHVVFIRTHGVLFCSPCKLYAFFHALIWVFCGLCTNYKLWTHTCCTVQWAPVVCTVLCVYTMFTLTSNNDEADLSQLPFFPPEHLTSLVTLHLNLVVAKECSADWDELNIFN